MKDNHGASRDGNGLGPGYCAHRGTIERVDGAVYLVKARLTAVGGRADMSKAIAEPTRLRPDSDIGRRKACIVLAPPFGG
jgi:hypothetical protein